MDFRQFLQNKSGTPSFQLSSQINGNILFQSCLNSVARKMYSSMDNYYYDQFYLNSKKLSQILPCNNQENFPECKDYCKWHENKFNNLNLEEFLTTMRYALPQRKIQLDTFLNNEKKIASKLFGTKGVLQDSKLNRISAPSVLTIFCHNKYEGFTGDDIGISDKGSVALL